MNQPVFSVASFAYPQVSSDTRSLIASRLDMLKKSDVFVLSTCLRIEIAIPGHDDDLRRMLKEVFDGLDIEQVALLSGGAAIEHVHRVAAGLESPVLGEPEILTQFRHALAAAEIRDGLFRKLLENCVAVGRSARELLPFNPHESLAAVAAQLVGHAERVAVFGSGVMATAVAEALKLLPSPPLITMAARTPSNVRVSDVEIVHIDERTRLLREEPAVISATSARAELLSGTALAEAVAGRASRLTLVDMAMPPDFSDPQNPLISYVDIDGLAERAARRTRSDAADSFVTAAADAMSRRISSHDSTGPFIKHLMDGADEVVEQTLERFARRLTTESDTAVLRQAAHAVARALLARPVTAIREAPTPSAVSVADAFGFDV